MEKTSTGKREERPRQGIGDAARKLELAEAEYVKLVLELEARLEPFYADTDVRRVIAECSDPARELYREILTLRGQAEGKPNERALHLLSDPSTEALKSPTNACTAKSDPRAARGSKAILQKDSVELQKGPATRQRSEGANNREK
ncbi:hypothetical protein DDZ13_07350 [Coraliomargarita sinensis]|uniref:Uncharacterized protein n=1 Tax=Coraliomargarita sinensis TaxID=2174842 RepID=A0A317ZG01_9BACT|nr:hypothetical protein [Coraliomargarita sinensis]PXA04340.1 hypothetical protein DDZ13_07350 [Coraliomargarita sinensis]